jgi:hypothetical protein
MVVAGLTCRRFLFESMSMGTVRWLVRVEALLLLLAGLLPGRPAAAQVDEPVSVAVFRTASTDAELHELAAAIDPVVLTELGEHASVRVNARPPLDLPATQLALDCVGETKSCLRTIAEQAGAEVLIAPSIERAGAETVLTVLYFDARDQGQLRNASRRFRGGEVERAALDAAPMLVREVLQIPEAAQPAQPAPEPAAPTAVTAADLEPVHEPAEPKAFPVLPVIVTAVGVGLLAGGVAFGLASNASEDDYADAMTDSREEVDAAFDKLDDAETQALLSNIGFGAGAAVTALGVVLLALHLSAGPEEASAQLAPQLGPGHLGLLLRGTFSGADR